MCAAHLPSINPNGQQLEVKQCSSGQVETNPSKRVPTLPVVPVLVMPAGKKKKSLADFAIVRRIHFIFERAVRKFKTDLSLWTAWLEFCRSSNSNRRLGRVVARALQIHPTGTARGRSLGYGCVLSVELTAASCVMAWPFVPLQLSCL